jgi:hypothetical protein
MTVNWMGDPSVSERLYPEGKRILSWMAAGISGSIQTGTIAGVGVEDVELRVGSEAGTFSFKT